MDTFDAIVFSHSTVDTLAVPGFIKGLGLDLRRAQIELGEVEHRERERMPEGMALVLLLPRNPL